MPAIFQNREFAAAGGLLSYGSDITDSYRLTGIYAGRILNGAKPSELPVQKATKVELYINLKTAKALGINVPNTLIGRADGVSANSGHWPALTLIGWVAKPEGLRADSDRLGFHRLSPRQLIA